MTLPGQTISKIEGNAAGATTSPNTMVFIGVADNSGSGWQNAGLFKTGRSQTVFDIAGQGPVASAAAEYISDAKKSAAVVTMTGSLTSSITDLTSGSSPNRTWGPTTSWSVTGTPNNLFQLSVNVVAGGNVQNGVTVNYSLDDANGTGGLEPTNSILLTANRYGSASQVLANTGCTLLMSGDFVTNDSMRALLQPRGLSASDIAAGVASVQLNRAVIGGTPLGITVVGTPPTNTQAALNAVALNTAMVSLEEHDIRTQAIMEARQYPTFPLTPGSKVADGAAWAMAFSSYVPSEGIGIALATDFVQQIVPENVPGLVAPMRSEIALDAARLGSVDLNTCLAWKKLGAYGRCVGLPAYDEYNDGELYTNEVNQALGLRTYPNQAGVYPTNDTVKCANGSTYNTLARCRTVNYFCDVVQAAQDQYTLAQFNTKTDGSGQLAPADKSAVESDVRQQVKASNTRNQDNPKVNKVTDFSYTVNGENNFAQTQELQSDLQIAPTITAKTIRTNVSFTTTINGTTVSK